MGKTLEEAMKITNKIVAQELGGLPKNKLHCSNLGADALHAAIENYRGMQAAARKAEEKREKHLEAEEECACPYCEGPLEGVENSFGKCRVDLVECPKCGQITKKGEACLHCGAEAAG